MATVLPSAFFRRPVLEVAPDLLGTFLVRRLPDGSVLEACITEVEAYDGPEDKACHAARGRTPRTEVMFGPAGRWYVYFVYGMHWMLNVVTGEEGYPAAVLIRGAGEWSGPARLTKALAINRTFNAAPADPASGLWIEERGVTVPKASIRQTPRIGVDYAGEWAKKPWRFMWKEET